MSIKEVYEAADGDYAGTLARHIKEERLAKFLRLFLKDDSYQKLVAAMKARDVKAAFAAAHTLKGVSGNVGMTAIQSASGEVTEMLRHSESVDGAVPLMAPLDKCFQKAKKAIEQMEV